MQSADYMKTHAARQNYWEARFNSSKDRSNSVEKKKLNRYNTPEKVEALQQKRLKRQFKKIENRIESIITR